MKAIVIGAGRGSRLKALTEGQPKTYATVGGRRILDWILEAFEGAGLDTPAFVGGYRIEQIRGDYPQLQYFHNVDWERNNILASLMVAEPAMDEGFVCSYADILFRKTVVSRALAHPGDIVLCVDTDWRSRYSDRSQHPEDDAEKVAASGDRVTRIDRGLGSDQAAGEYIGVAKFSAAGAAALRESFHRSARQFAGRPWRGAAAFEKAYLIQLIQEMIEGGIPVHLATTSGDYMEIDTEEDYELANTLWLEKFGRRGDKNDDE